MKFFMLLVSLALLTVLHSHALPHRFVKRGLDFVLDSHALALPHRLVKRELVFVECPTQPPTPLLKVTASTDSPTPGAGITFTYSGPIDHDINADDAVGSGWLDASGNPLQDPASEAVCTGSECPIKAGTAFTKTLDDTAPASLPSAYFIVVAVGNPGSDALYACGIASVTSSN